MATLRETSIPGAADTPATPPGSWLEAFKTLNLVLPQDSPCIVVIDELPWLLRQDPNLEGQLQTAWDRLLSTKPVLLLLVGSDPHMMAAFTGYERPFYRASGLHRRSESEDPASPLFSTGETMVNSEFPNPDQARRVLEAIGHGERTFSNIAAAAGSSPTDPVKAGSLAPGLVSGVVRRGASLARRRGRRWLVATYLQSRG